MAYITQYNSVTSVSGSDLFLLYGSNSWSTRKASAEQIKEYCNSGITATDDKETQYSAPSSSGFSVSITDSSSSIWLILTPTGTFATGTIVLPSVSNCVDKQEILVNCTQIVTALTISANGATVTGAPTTLSANGFFRLRFDDATSTWYRVG